MMKDREVKKLLIRNRSVDADKLREALVVLRELRKRGVIDEGRFETIPFSKRIEASDSEPNLVWRSKRRG